MKVLNFQEEFHLRMKLYEEVDRLKMMKDQGEYIHFLFLDNNSGNAFSKTLLNVLIVRLTSSSLKFSRFKRETHHSLVIFRLKKLSNKVAVVVSIAQWKKKSFFQ